jgi:hypothetical protein
MSNETSPRSQAVDYFSKWGHHRIGTRIRVCDEFIVHIDKDGKLDWEVSGTPNGVLSNPTPAQQKELSQVVGEIVVCDTASFIGYAPEHAHQYKLMLGEAYVHWILGDADASRKLIAAARDYYRERSEEHSRGWYLKTTALATVPFVSIGVVAWLMRLELIALVGQSAFNICLAACTGAIGAMFSVIVRSGKLQVKASAGRSLHILEAVSRVCVGAIAGVIGYLAFTSELILPNLLKSPHRAEILFLVALAAGAGERMATSIISKFERIEQPRRPPKG